MEILFETERLLLRKFTFEDTDFIMALLNSPGWIEFIGERNVKTSEQAKAYLENGPIKSYEINGYGLSLVALKDNQTPIGMCGILKRDSFERPDIGFALLPQYAGNGYAFEVADATMHYAKDVLKISKIGAITLDHNKASIKLIEKIGLRFVSSYTDPDTLEELMLFRN